MLDRKEIKANARLAMKQQRGAGIGVLILFILLVTVAVLLSLVLGSVFSRTLLLGGLLSPVIMAFTILPLAVGMYGVFIKVYRHEATHATEIFHGFSDRYLHNVGGMMWVVLWVTIWALISIPLPALGVLVFRALGRSALGWLIPLMIITHFALLIPAIIKSLSYSMVPYLLADAPDMKVREAMKLSMRMTKGHKGALVVLYLSFIGWYLLSPFTLGILALVYVNPYLYTSLAGFYSGLKLNAIETGIVAFDSFAVEPILVVEEGEIELAPN